LAAGLPFLGNSIPKGVKNVAFLIQQGTSPTIVLVTDPWNFLVTPASYVIMTGTGAIAGVGGFVNAGGRCAITPTAGETGTLGDLFFAALNVGGDVIATVRCQVVIYNPATGPGGGDPWITPLPGAYVPGEAGNILGNLAAGSANAILDQVNGVETGVTPRDSLKAMLAVLAGLLQSQGNVAIFQNPGGTKNRVVVGLGAGGQRTSITFDFS
jgi:hypothetical protein